jgi:hypothetical protein
MTANHDTTTENGDRIKERTVRRGPEGAEETVEINLDRLLQTAARYTGNPEILRIERDLRDEGVDLDNPALPVEEHPTAGTITAAECRDRIEAETDAENPRRDRIAGLNARIRHLEGEA